MRRPLDGVDVVRCRGESNVGGICDKNDCVVDVSAVERLICERNLALQDEKLNFGRDSSIQVCIPKSELEFALLAYATSHHINFLKGRSTFVGRICQVDANFLKNPSPDQSQES